MSHHGVFSISPNTIALLDIFAHAAQEHQAEEGYQHSCRSPYTLSEVKKLSPMTAPMAERELSDAYYSLSSLDPRNASRFTAVAAPIISDVVYREKVIDVTISAEELCHGTVTTDLIYKLAQRAARPGELVESAVVLTSHERRIQKVEVNVPDEKVVSKFFVHPQGVAPHRVDWSEGYDTQAQARAEAVRRLEGGQGRGDYALSVVKMSRRESGVDLLTVRRVTKKVMTKIKVKFAKPNPGAETEGWGVFMDCHH